MEKVLKILDGLEKKQGRLVDQADEIIDKIFEQDSIRPKNIPDPLRAHYDKQVVALQHEAKDINQVISYLKQLEESQDG